MGIKHRLSSSSDAIVETDKRLRLSLVPKIPYRQCLHCNSAEHDFTQCEVTCAHCGHLHHHRRCPDLSVAFYTPGAFRRCVAPRSAQLVGRAVSPPPRTFESDAVRMVDRSSDDWTIHVAEDKIQQRLNDAARPSYEKSDVKEAMDVPAATGVQPPSSLVPVKFESAMDPAPHFNPQRATMIASTPVLDPSPTIKKERQLTPGGGPQTSGMNTLPLGPKQPIDTSWTLDNRRSSLRQGPQQQMNPTSAPQLALDPSITTSSVPHTISLDCFKPNLAPKTQPAPPSMTAPVDRVHQPPLPSMTMSKPQPQAQVRPVQTAKLQASPSPIPTLTAELETQAGRQPDQLRPSLPKSRDTAREMAAWEGLQAAITKAIEDAAAYGKPFNGPNSVEWRTERALKALKPIILGETPPREEVQFDRTVQKARQMEQRSIKIVFGEGESFKIIRGDKVVFRHGKK